ncbi:hypothetical protein B0H11DRAFT_584844 [Mycena galericulata]|nr:hypothetical protein B0H11DRAFT_584844 [Mycena galericulata]
MSAAFPHDLVKSRHVHKFLAHGPFGCAESAGNPGHDWAALKARRVEVYLTWYKLVYCSSAPTPWIFHSPLERNDDGGIPMVNTSKMATARNHSGSGFAESIFAPPICLPKILTSDRPRSSNGPIFTFRVHASLCGRNDSILYTSVKTAIRRSLLPSPLLLPAPTPCTAPPSHIFILRTTMPLPPPIAHSPATTRRRAPPRSIARRQTVNKLRARVGVRGRHTYLAPLREWRDHFYHDGDWPAEHALVSSLFSEPV